MTSPTSALASVRLLDTAAAQTLSDLAAILDDLQTVLRSCERLLTELATPAGQPDDLLLESIWTTALLSYARCFHRRPSGAGLTDSDVTATALQGDVLRWHGMLIRMRKHFADPATNPRERFSVGAVEDAGGQVSGIAITGARQPSLDDVTVRQTGALAYQLSRLVDQRITEQQARVLEAAQAMPKGDLEDLPLIDVAEPEATTPNAAPSTTSPKPRR